jgi:tetratricopeptide (TPR) repeat protein
MLSKHSPMVCSAACILLLGACATAPAVVSKPPTLGQLMGQATQAVAAGQKDKAVSAWKAAAAAFPAEKTPWTQLAQAKYDAGQYGEAIIDAQEVLLRDPNDTLANSIVAISGLRLSTRALADLSRENGLSGSLRTESQDLARLLRESLGETVLVPAHDKAPQRVAHRAAARHADADSAANPFGNLK